MKIEVTLKDPDGFDEGLRDAVSESLDKLENLDKEEKELLREKKQDDISGFLQGWVRYGEYVTLVFDTETGTAEVKKREGAKICLHG